MVRFSEVVVCRLPRSLVSDEQLPGVIYPRAPIPYVISANNCRIAFRGRDASGQFAVIDGDRGPTYDRVGTPVFSANSVSVGYQATTSGKTYAVLGGRRWPVGYHAAAPPRFTPDGRRCFFPGRRGDQWVLAVDGREFGGHEEVRSPLASPDSRRIAYVAVTAGKSCVVVDGQPDAIFDDVYESSLVFSPDSRHYAYVAREGDSRHIVRDGCPYLSFDDDEPVELNSDDYSRARVLHFTRDSRRLRYCVPRSGKYYFGENRLLAGPFAEVDRYTNLISPNDRRVALGVVVGRCRMKLFLDGRVSLQAYVHIAFPTFSPDSKRFACVVTGRRNGRRGSRVFLDGEGGAWHDEVQQLGFSPDSRRFAYAAQERGQWFAVIDGAADLRRYGYVGLQGFTADSHHSAYFARREDGWVMVIDGTEGPTYERRGGLGEFPAHPGATNFAWVVSDSDGVAVLRGHKVVGRYDDTESSPMFDPTGKHFAYCARRRGKCYLVVDGEESKAFDGLVDSYTFRFDSATRLRAFVRRGSRLVRVDAVVRAP